MWPFSFGLESTTLEGDEMGVSSVSFTEEVFEIEMAKYLHNKLLYHISFQQTYHQLSWLCPLVVQPIHPCPIKFKIVLEKF